MSNKYYEAYDDRYKVVHTQTGNAWAGKTPSIILKDILTKYGATFESSILEIGCGEGQNALYLQQEGFNVFASDVSPVAINWCKKKALEHNTNADNYFVLDVLDNSHTAKYDFIYTVSTLHMLVLQEDRKAFLDFIYTHLKDNGKAIITIMGDGKMEKKDSDITKAFDLSTRTMENGETIQVANTTCKIVNWQDFFTELNISRLNILEHFTTNQISGFNISMVAIVERK